MNNSPGTAASKDAWSVVLPAAWWQIPLATEESRQTAIEHLLEMQTAGAQIPQDVRDYLHSLLASQARTAANLADLMAISIHVIAGVALPATILVSTLPSAGSLDHILIELLGAHPQDGLATVPVGPVGAIRRRSVGMVTEQGLDIPMTTVQYYIPASHLPVLGHLSFSTPLSGELGEAIETLFEAVASTFAWNNQPAQTDN